MIAAAYLESAVYSARPEELAGMLYQAALSAVQQARRHLRNGDTGNRTRAVNRAHAITGELMLALNHAAAPDLSRRLASLYAYMQQRLLDAEVHCEDAPLAEVGRLFSILLDGWMSALPAPASPR